jgi:hypothetical protein
MKLKLNILLVIACIIICFLIKNQYCLNKELKEAVHLEKQRKKENEILIQLILLKKYQYNDFNKIIDKEDIVSYIIVPQPNISPISVNNLVFFFSRDSTLRIIRQNLNDNDSILKIIDK